MSKKILKKITPATYAKVESSNEKLFTEIEKINNNRFGSIENRINTLKILVDSLDKKITQQKQSILESAKNILEQQKKFGARQDEISKKVDSISLETKKNNEKFESISHENTKKIENIVSNHTKTVDGELLKHSKKLDEITGMLNKMEQKYLYNNNYERRVIESFYEYYERDDFKDLFLNLIKGLDNEDVELIVQILQRQRLAKDSMNESIDIFSKEEQEQILRIKKELDLNVFRVSDDMFCLKHYFLPVNHFESSVFYYKHGIDCIENLDAIRNKDILDVGGFIGDSILVLKPLTDKRVFSFEAISEHYELMKQTVKLNNLQDIVLEKMALGNENGTIEMVLAGSSSAITTNGVVTTRGYENVQICTLDSYMEGKDVNVGLIKVDIEGAEQDFLKGARKTIEKHKPVLLMSIYHNADDFFNIKPMLESWNLGYKFRIHKPVDYSVSREVLLIAEVR